MLIKSKKALHRVLDEMIASNQNVREIGLCRSYIQYDSDIYLKMQYKGIELTYYDEWFAQGKIVLR